MRKVIINSQGKALLYNGQFLSVGNDYAYLTGNAPLSFQASAGPFGYLKQLGKCEQVSSPTPSSPVDIYCNNGALKLVDDELPAGYKRIKSIKFDGDFHYETGEKLYGSDVITITLSQTSSSGQNVFGCYSGTASGRKNLSLYIYGNGSTSNSYLRMDETLYRPRFGTGVRTLKFGNLDSTDGFQIDVATTPSTYETTSSAFIGWLPNSTSPHYTGAIDDSIRVSDRLLWIPCERQSDGEIGYYEKYSGVFIEKTGDGTPVSGGYDYSHFVVKAVGTPEVLNVTHNLVEEPSVVSNTYVRAGNASDTKPRGGENYGYGWYCSGYIPVLPETAYKTIVAEWNAATGAGLCFYAGQSVESCISGVTTQRQDGVEYEFITPEGCNYVRFSWKTGGRTGGEMYKLSEIQSSSVEDLLAVGDYQDEQDIIRGAITRNVGIVVFDGTEGWTKPAGADYFRLDGMFTDAILYSSDNPAIICSHFVGRRSKISASGMKDGDIKLGYGYTTSPYRLYLKYAAMATAEDLTAWLATQYAAGTPVIVIYPLATGTTESVAGQSLNTVNGGNVISVTAEVSEVPLDIEYLEA